MDEYNRILKELCIDSIARKVIMNYYGKTIEKIYDLIQQEYIKATSNYWFPGKQRLKDLIKGVGRMLENGQ